MGIRNPRKTAPARVPTGGRVASGPAMLLRAAGAMCGTNRAEQIGSTALGRGVRAVLVGDLAVGLDRAELLVALDHGDMLVGLDAADLRVVADMPGVVASMLAIVLAHPGIGVEHAGLGRGRLDLLRLDHGGVSALG